MNYMDKPGCPFPRQAQRTAKPQYYFKLKRKEKAQTSELEKASSQGQDQTLPIAWLDEHEDELEGRGVKVKIYTLVPQKLKKMHTAKP